jgi:hypothetical protein
MGLSVTMPTADPPGGQTRVRSPWAIARAAVGAPFTRRQRDELLYCLAGRPFALINPLVLLRCHRGPDLVGGRSRAG